VCIVEGHGDSGALPIVIRRIAGEIDPAVDARIPHPIRIPKSRLVKPGELERAVGLAARKLDGPGGILVLLDSDEDCPATAVPPLLARARSACGHVPVSVVMAKREFEAWFLASAESLRGRRGLPADLAGPSDPEGISDPKGWLAERMERGSYSPVLDQPALAAGFQIAAARRCGSFDKCYREIARIVGAGRTGAEGEAGG
jgi:hypothetical protein